MAFFPALHRATPHNPALFLEIHKVFLRKTAFIRTQFFSGFALAELCGIAIEFPDKGGSHYLPCCGNQYGPNFCCWLEVAGAQNGYTRNVCGADFWVNEGGFYYDRYDNMMPFGSFDCISSAPAVGIEL